MQLVLLLYIIEKFASLHVVLVNVSFSSFFLFRV